MYNLNVTKKNKKQKKKRGVIVLFHFIRTGRHHNIPLQVSSSKRYSAGIIFKNETTSSKYESFKVTFPFYLADINVESFLILCRHLVQQANRVVADESPLMRREEFQTGKSTIGFGI